MLNNRGWGYRTFIIMGCILLLALLLVSILIIRLYSQLPNLNNVMSESLSYDEIEENVNLAAMSYYNDYYKDELHGGVVVVSIDNLLKYNLLEEKDLLETTKNDRCSGYALISLSDNIENKDEVITKAYVKCKNYTSKGYQAWRVN